jgi:hypothetical protein
MRQDVLTLAGLALAIAACGGGQAEQTTTTTTTTRRVERTAEEEAAADAQAGVQIEGLMGTISQDQVNNTLQPRTESFARCFAQGAGVAFLGGDIRLNFRIHVDGSVAWVFPSASTIGHRDVERCIVDRARGIRFPRPRGGEAEFSWGFGYDHPPDVRSPVTWDATRVASTLASQGATLVQQCAGRRGFRVTAYVQSGGTVIAVGAAAHDPDSAEQLDCIATGVRGWSMPDPGSYPAKVSFDI